MTTTLYTTSFKGIGQITTRELRRRFGDALSRIRSHRVRDYDLTQFNWNGDISDLKSLGTTEDVFFHLTTVPLSGHKKDLQTLRDALSKEMIEPALRAHRTVNKASHGRTQYRAVVQASMQSWQHYRRTKIKETIEAGIRDCYPRWRCVTDGANLEFWVQQTGKEIQLGLRLTDATMRHRDYRVANLPASLRPTIARAVVHLTRPVPGDIFLDPMCGAGTLLIERALAGRHEMLYGGDLSEDAVRAALENFGNRHKPRDIQYWDARTLPLPDQSVDKVATNPPWGRQIGSPAEIRALYTATLREIDRVLKPNGIVAIITSEWRAIKPALAQTDLTVIEQIKDIGVLGRRADIFVAQKFQ